MSSDEGFLRLAIALARQGRERGGHPFGAVLALDGRVVHQVYDRCVELSDPTFHSELSLISEYCRAHQIMSLEGYTLYASAEPCPMCAGAIHWARISRVVFSVSQAMLQELSGGRPKPTAASLINIGHQPIEVVGPLIPEEGLAVFEGYAFTANRAIPSAGRSGDGAPRT
jgi:tRNA(Arg) A34 adenosine deaminase TadA